MAFIKALPFTEETNKQIKKTLKLGEELLIPSRRELIAREVEELMFHRKLKRNTLGVITAVQMLGYLKPKRRED